MADNIGIRTSENVIQGIDAGGKIKNVGIKGAKTDELKVAEQNSDLLKNIVHLLELAVDQRNEAFDLETTLDDTETNE